MWQMLVQPDELLEIHTSEQNCVTEGQRPVPKLSSNAGPSMETVDLVLHSLFIFGPKHKVSTCQGNKTKCLGWTQNTIMLMSRESRVV